MDILLTGATGFVGNEIHARLLCENHAVRAAVRVVLPNEKFENMPAVGDINPTTTWSAVLNGASIVIHSAARVHVMNDTANDPLELFREVNTLGTLNLARQAAAAGVKRFIFISSIKVSGESTDSQIPFKYSDVPSHEDPYGISKYEAEEGLKRIAAETGMEVVIIRPVLVYGPGVKGNFKSLVSFVKRGFPLPLGSINNKRSMVGLDNLVDLIITCIDHPKAANQTFLVSDDQDVSTTVLLRKMGQAFGKKVLLLPVPVSALRFVGKIFGKSAEVDRLCGSLQVDIEHTKNTLNWKPPYTMEQQLSKIAASYSNKED